MPFLERAHFCVTELRAQGDILTAATNGEGRSKTWSSYTPVPFISAS